ncbi:MAG: bifunctional phosphopantothenoylcysteine decarboxylase/phosphopantothenate--cysteine ligase CoaBC [Roseiflexaceae bacterium]|nr:bifunctional phosphopantothenoylcysteine decarboxylase/phosphopantothenate--cysteine ligase CoaBC [Roseiflexaceae bacterium]
MSIMRGKQIVLGVSGSIAAYKVAELARRLTLDGAAVDVVMTEAAKRFVGPATFQGLTGRPVLDDMWALPEDGVVGHVALGQRADLVVIAPASANTLARIAAGISDDLLTTTVLATPAPVLLAPAMNPHMLANPATQANLSTLRQRGMTVIEPAYGRMAEPMIGQGRLPDIAEIEGLIHGLLGQRYGSLRGLKVVVTAGANYEPIDPVRFIGNRSSGRQGYALAAEARDRGAKVVLVSGPAAIEPPAGVELVRVETAHEMEQAVHAALPGARLLLMCAAVADYRAADVAPRKLKKADDEFVLRLVRNPDILAGIAQRSDLIKVGFAAETDNLIEYAQAKLERKGLDMIVANEAVASIGSAESAATLISADRLIQLPQQPKQQTAAAILDAVETQFAARLHMQNIRNDTT